MDNSNEPGRSPEDKDPREKPEGESDSVWDLPIPDGVPDSLLESFQGPGASGVDSVGDLEKNRFPDPSPPSEEWLAAQDFSDDLPQEGWEEQNSAAFSEMDDLSGEDETPGFEPHPDDLAIEPCKWGLLHNLVDSLTVNVKALESTLRQLEKEEFLQGDYRLSRYQQIWKPLYNDHSLKKRIWKLYDETGIQWIPMDDLALEVEAALPFKPTRTQVSSQWWKAIEAFVARKSEEDSEGEGDQHE